MRKIYKQLTEEQRKKGIVFTSTLSEHTTEWHGDTTHEVLESDKGKEEKIARLLNDKFFNNSHFKYNIIRE